MFDDEHAAAAAAILATSVFFVFYADEARSVTLTLLASTCTAVWFVRAVMRERPLDYVGFALGAVVCIYANALAVFFISGLIVSLAVMRPSRAALRSFALAAVFIGAAIVPLALLIHSNSTAQIDWIQRSRPSAVLHFIASILGGDGGRGHTGFLLGLAEATIVTALMIAGIVAKWGSDGRTSAIVASIWFVVPLAAGILVDHLVQPILVARYFPFELVPAAVLAGAGLIAVKRSIRPALASAIVGVLAVTTLYRLSTIQREDWRSAAALVQSAALPGDAIVVWRAGTVTPLKFAFGETGRVLPAGIVYPTGPMIKGLLFPDPPAGFVADMSRHYARVWLVLSHTRTDGSAPNPFDSLARYYSHDTTRSFSGIVIRMYSR